MFIITIIIFIPITQQPVHDRLAENQPTAVLSSLNEYENGMGKSETELWFVHGPKLLFLATTCLALTCYPHQND